MLAMSGTSVLNPACKLITGSAALLVCGAASALLKLQERPELESRDRSCQAADSFIGSACLQWLYLHRQITASAIKASTVAT